MCCSFYSVGTREHLEYTVRFFNSAGVAKSVVVDTELPLGTNGAADSTYYDHPVIAAPHLVGHIEARSNRSR